LNQSTKLYFASDQREFTATLNKRVADYFKSNDISRHANSEMIAKTVFMFSLYLIPYMLIVTGVITNVFWMIPLVLLMSIGTAGIGLSVMHDANHGAYSSRQWINSLLGYSLNLVGASAFNWKIQHNVMHHTYTNIHEHDEDISPRGVLRLSPDSKWKNIHKYQFIYAWFLYGLLTLVWVVLRDFMRTARYQREGLVKKYSSTSAKEWFILITTKIVYVGYTVIIPLIFTSLSLWQILLGIVAMHYLAGFILSIIFQPAHVVEGTEYPMPDQDNMLENNWAIHQLRTTTNFGNKSRWFSWFVGGLNFQIEHHLFPHICHVHYRKISKIVQSTAMEFGLPYKKFNSFLGALKGHTRLLKQLGAKPI